ncbi:serine/arginine-rich splicing factor SR45a-like [Trifolium pratense]|uniref:serine/arginine-rich splicing factor SR45a-like n=1 Tax=Trifolium pratense TaxID=57577 RepID=UPI001E691FFC|nr:serine/arginine-rich splicing factor SR45a-like [Trifolium pratense]
MRERGRERERSAVPRAHLGHPSRSSPSPEVRQKRGGASIVSGGWTEVRRRRRNGFRGEDGGKDRPRQSRYHHYSRSISPSGNRRFDDRYYSPEFRVRDRSHTGRNQSRYSKEGRYISRDRSQEYGHFVRSGKARSRSAFKRQQQVHGGARRRQELEEERRRSDDVNYGERVRNNQESLRDGHDSRLVGGGDLCDDHKLVNGNKHDGVVSKHGEESILGSDLKRYVSFYFTNFPA